MKKKYSELTQKEKKEYIRKVVERRHKKIAKNLGIPFEKYLRIKKEKDELTRKLRNKKGD